MKHGNGTWKDPEGLPSTSSLTALFGAAYATLTGCTLKIVHNPDFLLEKAVTDMAAALR